MHISAHFPCTSIRATSERCECAVKHHVKRNHLWRPSTQAYDCCLDSSTACKSSCTHCTVQSVGVLRGVEDEKKRRKKDAFFRYAKLVLHTGRSRESYKPSIYWSNVVQANLDDVFRLPLFLLRSREKKRKKKRYD